ncbi:MAG TPA: vancomycin resistance protein, partial [Candidatus Faecivivens stercoripullorum]|nr:vancomycin resistance protein [Candidatus Faecivivens stercoripullorum]
TVLRDTIDPVTGNHIKQETIRVNHARVLYNTDHLTIIDSDQS